MSDAFSARLDAKAGTAGPKEPQPYVKDFFRHWKVGGSHFPRMGVTPPLASQAAEPEGGLPRTDTANTMLGLAAVVSALTKASA
jgi:hypothetical protein